MQYLGGDMPVIPKLPLWPAMMSVNKHDELVYLATAEDLLQEYGAYAGQALEIIDSKGYRFSVKQAEKAIQSSNTEPKLALISSGEAPLPVSRILAKVQRHAALTGQCCTAKMAATDYSQVFEMLAYLEEGAVNR